MISLYKRKISRKVNTFSFTCSTLIKQNIEENYWKQFLMFSFYTCYKVNFLSDKIHKDFFWWYGYGRITTKQIWKGRKSFAFVLTKSTDKKVIDKCKEIRLIYKLFPQFYSEVVALNVPLVWSNKIHIFIRCDLGEY